MYTMRPESSTAQSGKLVCGKGPGRHLGQRGRGAETEVVAFRVYAG